MSPRRQLRGRFRGYPAPRAGIRSERCAAAAAAAITFVLIAGCGADGSPQKASNGQASPPSSGRQLPQRADIGPNAIDALRDLKPPAPAGFTCNPFVVVSETEFAAGRAKLRPMLKRFDPTTPDFAITNATNGSFTGCNSSTGRRHAPSWLIAIQRYESAQVAEEGFRVMEAYFRKPQPKITPQRIPSAELANRTAVCVQRDEVDRGGNETCEILLDEYLLQISKIELSRTRSASERSDTARYASQVAAWFVEGPR